jgi:hypothetical protein
MNDPPDIKDSCVVIYWAELPMAPGERRVMGFTYGLGHVGKAGSDERPEAPQGPGTVKIALTSGGEHAKGRTITVSAYIKNPQANQTVTLRLPGGLEFANDTPDKQVKPEAGKTYTAVSWKVKCLEAGTKHLEADLKATGNKLATAQHDVTINTRGVFDR